MDHPVASPTVRIMDDPAAFAAAAAPAFAADPIGTNVVASVVSSVLSGASAPDAGWLVVERGGQVVALAMRTPPFPLHLTPMPDEAAQAIAHTLHEHGHDALPGVSGDVRATAIFADRWAALAGITAALAVDEGVHVLADLTPPTGVRGAVRTAVAADLDLVTEWMTGFAAEVHAGSLPRPVDRDGLAHRIAAGGLLLWEDGGRPVSLAGWHPPSAGVARVGPVWTPPEHRRHGFAAAVTAAATRAASAAGAEHVMLFTDLANPTSNGVYARLGYRRIRTASEWTFTTPS